MDSFRTNIEVVRKLDPRGSFSIAAPVGSLENVEIFQYVVCFLVRIILFRYDMKCPNSPLVVHSQAYCGSDDTNRSNTIIHYDFRFINTSNVFDVTQIIASVVIPQYEKIIAVESVTSEGNKTHKMKVTLASGSRNLSITCPKIKLHTEISISISIKVSLVFVLFEVLIFCRHLVSATIDSDCSIGNSKN